MGRGSAQRAAIFRVARQVEKIDLVDGLEARVVGEFPDDSLVTRHFESLRLFAQEAAGKIIADDGVSVRQTLASGGQSERVPRRFVFAELPGDFQVLIEFDDLGGGPERDT